MTSDQDRQRRHAARIISKLIRTGQMRPASEIPCVECGHIGPDRAHAWHHHKGYSPEHAADVIPVCHPCHRKLHCGPLGPRRKPDIIYCGKRIKRARMGRGVNVRDMARMAGVAESTVLRIEKGLVYGTPRIVSKLATALGMPLAPFIRDLRQPDSESNANSLEA